MHIITHPQQLADLHLPGISPSNAHSPHGACVTIGNFDGVHVGHRVLIRTMLDKARTHGMPGVVVTFWPHPLTVLAGRHAPPQITEQAERRRLLRDLGVDILLEIPFTRELAILSPSAFVDTVLMPLHCRHLIIGYDFSLGKGRAGNHEVLRQLGAARNFDVEQVPPVIVNDAVASSTRVRDLVRAGDMWELQAVLGRFYHLSGPVVHGFARGAGLGFPTANMRIAGGMLPKSGVYATWASAATTAAEASTPSWEADSRESLVRPGVTNIGTAPTFGNAELSVETFLLDTDENLYGKELTLHFVQRLRDEQRFENLDALKERIARDVTLARGVLESAVRP